MARIIKVAAIQFACDTHIEKNIETATALVVEAAEQGANVILLQELFETPYFCQHEYISHYAYATPIEAQQTIKHFAALAKRYNVVLPISFYERSNQAKYNSIAMINADGSLLGTYRKTHIPDGPGYEEKFYFSPGDTGFKVWDTQFGKIGVGICWDQWFPEAARCMTLMGAEMLLYPTAIGSEPYDSTIDSKDHWQICMRGHAGSNVIPVIASNRIGVEHATTENMQSSQINFYGSSFICDGTGKLLKEASRDKQEILLCDINLDEHNALREEWGLFRDRRPEHYKAIMTLDGKPT